MQSAIAFLRLSGRAEPVARAALRCNDDRRTRNVCDASTECANHARRGEQCDHPFLHFVLPLLRKGPRGPFVECCRRVRQKLKLMFDWLVVALTFVDCVAPDAASASIVYCAAAAGDAASATGSEPEYVPTIGAAVGTFSA